jgi:hypothetical protein
VSHHDLQFRSTYETETATCLEHYNAILDAQMAELNLPASRWRLRLAMPSGLAVDGKVHVNAFEALPIYAKDENSNLAAISLRVDVLVTGQHCFKSLTLHIQLRNAPGFEMHVNCRLIETGLYLQSITVRIRSGDWRSSPPNIGAGMRRRWTGADLKCLGDATRQR